MGKKCTSATAALDCMGQPGRSASLTPSMYVHNLYLTGKSGEGPDCRLLYLHVVSIFTSHCQAHTQARSSQAHLAQSLGTPSTPRG